MDNNINHDSETQNNLTKQSEIFEGYCDGYFILKKEIEQLKMDIAKLKSLSYSEVDTTPTIESGTEKEDLDMKEPIIENIDTSTKLILDDKPIETSPIKHIVLSGGGAQGFSFYGFLRETNKAGFWDLKNIKTIHGTSIGAFIGTILCMGFEWDILDDFLIKRPWHTVLKLDIQAYLRVFEKKGMVPKTIYEETMKPLFAAKDIPLNVTMLEFYQITGIELHLYTVELNKLCTVDIS